MGAGQQNGTPQFGFRVAHPCDPMQYATLVNNDHMNSPNSKLMFFSPQADGTVAPPPTPMPHTQSLAPFPFAHPPAQGPPPLSVVSYVQPPPRQQPQQQPAAPSTYPPSPEPQYTSPIIHPTSMLHSMPSTGYGPTAVGSPDGLKSYVMPVVREGDSEGRDNHDGSYHRGVLPVSETARCQVNVCNEREYQRYAGEFELTDDGYVPVVDDGGDVMMGAAAAAYEDSFEQHNGMPTTIEQQSGMDMRFYAHGSPPHASRNGMEQQYEYGSPTQSGDGGVNPVPKRKAKARRKVPVPVRPVPVRCSAEESPRCERRYSGEASSPQMSKAQATLFANFRSAKADKRYQGYRTRGTFLEEEAECRDPRLNKSGVPESVSAMDDALRQSTEGKMWKFHHEMRKAVDRNSARAKQDEASEEESEPHVEEKRQTSIEEQQKEESSSSSNDQQGEELVGEKLMSCAEHRVVDKKPCPVEAMKETNGNAGRLIKRKPKTNETFANAMRRDKAQQDGQRHHLAPQPVMRIPLTGVWRNPPHANTSPMTNHTTTEVGEKVVTLPRTKASPLAEILGALHNKGDAKPHTSATAPPQSKSASLAAEKDRKPASPSPMDTLLEALKHKPERRSLGHLYQHDDPSPISKPMLGGIQTVATVHDLIHDQTLDAGHEERTEVETLLLEDRISMPRTPKPGFKDALRAVQMGFPITWEHFEGFKTNSDTKLSTLRAGESANQLFDVSWEVENQENAHTDDDAALSVEAQAGDDGRNFDERATIIQCGEKWDHDDHVIFSLAKTPSPVISKREPCVSPEKEDPRDKSRRSKTKSAKKRNSLIKQTWDVSHLNSKQIGVLIGKKGHNAQTLRGLKDANMWVTPLEESLSQGGKRILEVTAKDSVKHAEAVNLVMPLIKRVESGEQSVSFPYNLTSQLEVQITSTGQKKFVLPSSHA